MKFSVVSFCSVALLSLQAVSAFAANSVSQQSVNGLKRSRSLPRSTRNARQSGNGQALMMSFPRGGAAIAANGVLSSLKDQITGATKTPSALFNSALLTLALTTTAFKIFQKSSESGGDEKQIEKPKSIKSLQFKFLSVFWLIRCADWLQGPYFYEVYSSKVFNGVQASMGIVSKLFLTGFASTALFGPLVGRAADSYGRKKGTLAFCLLYALGAMSTKSPLLLVLLLGRLSSGIGTSLLFSAPEAWLVGEAQKSGDDPDGSYLGETFGMAYAGDAIVAILAGQFAGAAASIRGPTGPFELSTGFLGLGALMTALLWKENVAEGSKGSDSNDKPTIREAFEVVKKDPKIMSVGAVQSLFEAAMYIFVLQWPPALGGAISKAFGEGAVTPYGTIFSCFMACCLLGSSMFGYFTKKGVNTETSTAGMLSVATLAMAGATAVTTSAGTSLWALIASFFLFEGCVGMYFPSIGTLRSKYVPDSHRSVIMNLFGIPLNALVVSVFLSLKRLGLTGALSISTGALGIAAASMFALLARTKKDEAFTTEPATT